MYIYHDSDGERHRMLHAQSILILPTCRQLTFLMKALSGAMEENVKANDYLIKLDRYVDIIKIIITTSCSSS